MQVRRHVARLDAAEGDLRDLHLRLRAGEEDRVQGLVEPLGLLEPLHRVEHGALRHRGQGQPEHPVEVERHEGGLGLVRGCDEGSRVADGAKANLVMDAPAPNLPGAKQYAHLVLRITAVLDAVATNTVHGGRFRLVVAGVGDTCLAVAITRRHQQVPAARVEHDLERLLWGADLDASEVGSLVDHLCLGPLAAAASEAEVRSVDLLALLDGLPAQLHRRLHANSLATREEAE
mmetsp:Transcript_89309/g.236157  ORF Transcript_89309/g.236157 Transcript_89309/m.236157 type:complete len:233 (-) Transcript_89309:143-841(-)